MLDDPQNSEQDVEYIATTIQRFRKNENAAQVQTAQVVGTLQCIYTLQHQCMTMFFQGPPAWQQRSIYLGRRPFRSCF